MLGGAACTTAAAPGKLESNIKVGLYTITYLGYFYRGDGLTLEQCVQKAKEYGYAGLELEAKRPHITPMDWPKDRCRKLRKYADDNGIEIYAMSALNDFSGPVPEHREAQLCYMRELLKTSADLGIKIMRVFAAWPGGTRVPGGGGTYAISRPMWEKFHEQFSKQQLWDWCRDGLAESAKWAADLGITLALQNHKPVTEVYTDMLKMVKEVSHPNLKCCLDAPILENNTDPAYIRKAAKDTGDLQVLSHFGGEYDRGPDGKTVRPHGKSRDDIFVGAMHDIGYKGYIGYELCHPLPVVDGKLVGQEFADKNAKLAAEYMRGLIASTKKSKA
jgi:sugar phosphate isomerase/epimerase